MASQLRGLEQVRGVMSASSLFLIADLPFAGLFVLVIFWLGGPLAIVPMISFPIALGLAFILAHGIRRSRSEEHTSELQSLMRISYAVFCLKKKKKKQTLQYRPQQSKVNHTDKQRKRK